MNECSPDIQNNDRNHARALWLNERMKGLGMYNITRLLNDTDQEVEYTHMGPESSYKDAPIFKNLTFVGVAYEGNPIYSYTLDRFLLDPHTGRFVPNPMRITPYFDDR